MARAGVHHNMDQAERGALERSDADATRRRSSVKRARRPAGARPRAGEVAFDVTGFTPLMALLRCARSVRLEVSMDEQFCNRVGRERISGRQIGKLIGWARGLGADSALSQPEFKFLQKRQAAESAIDDRPFIRA